MDILQQGHPWSQSYTLSMFQGHTKTLTPEQVGCVFAVRNLSSMPQPTLRNRLTRRHISRRQEEMECLEVSLHKCFRGAGKHLIALGPLDR